MKKNFYSTLLMLGIALLPLKILAWGYDVHISGAPEGKHGAVRYHDSLFVSVPVMLSATSYTINFYVSTDTGTSWSPYLTLPASFSSPIEKSKMLNTGADSMFCMFLTGDSIYTLDFKTNAITLLNAATKLIDFDAVASPNNNSLYVFVIFDQSQIIKRYSSRNGGQTWTGPVTVSSDTSAMPNAIMVGNRVFLNFYTLLMTPIERSEIDQYIYTEGSPGSIALANAFSVLADTNIYKSQALTVSTNNYYWLIYTSGNSTRQQSLYCRYSTTGGTSGSWSAPILIRSAVGTNLTFKNLSANSYYFSATNFGIDLTYYSEDTLLGPSAANDKMNWITTNNSAPGTFSTPVVYSDFTVTSSIYNALPITLELGDSLNHNPGFVWLEDNGSGPALWFDRLNSNIGVGINPILANAELKLYPNPSRGKLSIVLPQHAKDLKIFNNAGALEKSITLPESSIANNIYTMDLSDLPSGYYLIKVQCDKAVINKPFIISY